MSLAWSSKALFRGGGGFSHKEETDRRMSWDQDVNQTLRPPNPANQDPTCRVHMKQYRINFATIAFENCNGIAFQNNQIFEVVLMLKKNKLFVGIFNFSFATKKYPIVRCEKPNQQPSPRKRGVSTIFCQIFRQDCILQNQTITTEEGTSLHVGAIAGAAGILFSFFFFGRRSILMEGIL